MSVAGRRVRTDLWPAPDGPLTPLVTIAHLSDLHVCDAQSPARVEYLDRWADPDSPIVDRVGNVGSYRPQELLTAQVVEAMVQSVNAVATSPVGGTALDFAIVTGDNTDNAQTNELEWYLHLLDGGRVEPDSGDRTQWEGASALSPDPRIWHPDGDVADVLRARYGFPTVPGLTSAARRAFDATGLLVPWLAVHGNHDQLLQGTVVTSRQIERVATGDRKAIGLPAYWSADEVATLLLGLAACDPAALARLGEAHTVPVAADPERRIVDRAGFVAAHAHAGARPAGHGFTAANRTRGTAYYRHDHGEVTLFVLDTVDEYGGWEGSLDRAQFGWLRDELAQADADGRHAVLASHHPLANLVNATGPDRVLGGEFEAALDTHPSVALWLNGHSHQTTVTPHRAFWEVTAPSLIDSPQRGRVVELLRSADGLAVAATMLDHAGETPWAGGLDTPAQLAGLSRELAAKDWQDVVPCRDGTELDRDVLLPLPDRVSTER